ncbi:hypothetical protein ACQV2E_06705 [Pantoea allii]|uniref:hypothetical protein n=1 Tax=Pantoea TaxID=53335 RepID=UPI0011AA1D50|nr:hypothetical protein [Pantoea sp. SJZ147]TWD35332.1 hypothetical protein FBY13_112191 [Pantoea sp. SJZ147]
MNQKAYLASQAWFTTLFSLALNHFLVVKLQMAFFTNLVPGVSVTLSHGVILLIALIGIPSLAEIRLTKTLKDARAEYVRILGADGTAGDVKDACEKAIKEIDLAMLAKSKVKIKACQKDHEDSVK